MHFEQQQSLDLFLNYLFDQYKRRVPAVEAITKSMISEGIISSQQSITNDHIAFRTLGIPDFGIDSIEKIFFHLGYTKRDHYYFAAKKLNAFWYAPPSPEYPRIFLSELIIEQLSPAAQNIIHKYTDTAEAGLSGQVDLENGKAIGAFFHHPRWRLPSLADYAALLKESEYAAWVIYNRYYLNHYTISVHDLPAPYNTLENFNGFVEGLGIRLNTEGGKIKVSPDGLLRQSSTVAELQDAIFAAGGTKRIPGSYVEFAERLLLPEFSTLTPIEIRPEHRREGFEAGNADKIFESTYTSQTNLK